jgi:hypothetical protein
VGETEVDGYAPAFFLFMGIAVKTGQSLDKSGLAVVDMTGCSQYKMFHDSCLAGLVSVFELYTRLAYIIQRVSTRIKINQFRL